MESEKYTLCRLCLCSSDRLVDIFEEENQLEDAIKDLLNFTVVKRDDFPWLACRTCIEKLNAFRIFKSHCVDSKKNFEDRFPEEAYATVASEHNFCIINAIQVKSEKMDEDFPIYGDDTQVSNYFMTDLMEQKGNLIPELPSSTCENTDNLQMSVKCESDGWVSTDEQVFPEDKEENDKKKAGSSHMKIEPIIIKAPQIGGEIGIHFQILPEKKKKKKPGFLRTTSRAEHLKKFREGLSKRCALCPRRKDKKTRSFCVLCSKYICGRHMVKLCITCYDSQ